MTETRAAPRPSRKTVLALIVVFVGPLALAILLFAFHDRLPIPAAVTVGELILPPTPMPDLHPRPLLEAPLPTPLFRGHWTLLYMSQGRCDLDCEANLFKMRQVRLSMGRDMGRVERLLLIAPPVAHGALEQIARRYPGLAVAALERADRQALAQILGPGAENRIHIVDPLGNAMMRYPAEVPAKGLLKDLKRLLKVSQIG